MPGYFGLVHKDPASDYGISFPDVPGCISAAATLDEIRSMAAEALTMHLEYLCDEGKPLPNPSPIEVVAGMEDARDAVAIVLIQVLPNMVEATA